MGEAIAQGVGILIGGTLVWLVATCVAVAFTRSKAGNWFALIVAISWPLYLSVLMYDSHRVHADFQARNEAAVEAVRKEFANLCAALPPVEVLARRLEAKAVNVRFLGMRHIYQPADLDSRDPDKFICWLNHHHATCPRSNVIGVDLGFNGRVPECLLEYPQSLSCEVAFARHDTDRIRVENVTDRQNRFVLLVEPIRHEALIASYKLSLRDLVEKEDLARAKLVSFQPPPERPGRDVETLYCRSRDEIIAKMFAEAFPIAPGKRLVRASD